MSSNEENQSSGRATIAVVDARVGRLESAQAETDAKIVRIQLEQQHQRELITTRFSSLEALVTSNAAKTEAFQSRIESLITESMRNAGDLNATPAGRGVHDRLVKLETQVDRNEDKITRAEGMVTAMKWVIGSSLLGLVSGLIALANTLGANIP